MVCYKWILYSMVYGTFDRLLYVRRPNESKDALLCVKHLYSMLENSMVLYSMIYESIAHLLYGKLPYTLFMVQMNPLL